jgi:hypothetical protein
MPRRKKGYVVAAAGKVLVQLPANNEWGFCLVTADESFPGGIGVFVWECVTPDDPRVTAKDKERLGWLLNVAEVA